MADFLLARRSPARRSVVRLFVVVVRDAIFAVVNCRMKSFLVRQRDPNDCANDLARAIDDFGKSISGWHGVIESNFPITTNNEKNREKDRAVLPFLEK